MNIIFLKQGIINLNFFKFTLSIYLFFPEIFLFICLILFFLLFFSLSIKKRNFYPILLKPLLILYLISIFYTILLMINNISYNYVLFFYSYFSNNFIFALKIIFLIFFFFYLSFSYEYLYLKKIFILEFIFLLSISSFACILAFSANDFLLLYLLLELQNICVYILISLKRHSNIAIEAAIKYFIVSSVMMACFLYGISLCYFSSGLINFFDIELFLYYSNIDFFMLSGFFIIFFSLIVKNGIPPFHKWLIDVYSGCSLYILFYFILFLKFFYFSILFRLYYTFLELVSFFFSDLILILSLLSIFFGVIGALYQIKLTRLFIFSSISNSSFYLLLFLIELEEASVYFLYFSIFYLLNMFSIYLILSSFINWSTDQYLNKISNFSNLFQINIYYSIIFGLLLLNTSGFPPLFGFFYKFYMLSLLANLNLYLLIFITIVIFSVSFFYYIRIIKIMFLNKNKHLIFIKPMGFYKSYLLSFMLILNFNFIFFQNFILNLLFECLI